MNVSLPHCVAESRIGCPCTTLSEGAGCNSSCWAIRPTINGVQWHGLLPIDESFNPSIPNQFCHYTDKELFEFVRRIKSVGGAITINVPIDVEKGRIPDDSHSQLVRLYKSVFSKSTSPNK